MFNATCLIKTDIDTVNKCMGQNPYNPETFLQNFASRLTSFDDPLLNIYPTSEIAGNIEDEDVILGLREPQKLIEWAKTMKERTQCMAMAEFSAALMMIFLNALFRWMTANTGIRFTALMISSMNTTMILTMLWMLCIPSKLTVISTETTGVLPPIKT